MEKSSALPGIGKCAKCVLAGSLALSLLVAGCVGGKASVASDPQVCCGDTTTEVNLSPSSDVLSQSFGRIPQGQKIEIVFELKNEGDQPAVFDRSRPPNLSYPCCTTLSVDRDAIPPGESAKAVVSFDSTFRTGNIDIFGDVPFVGGKVNTKIHLGGQVKNELSVRPNALEFEQPGSKEFTVTGDDLFEQVELKGIDVRDPDVVVEEISREVKDKKAVYRVTWTGRETRKEEVIIHLLHTHPKIGPYPIHLAPPGYSF